MKVYVSLPISGIPMAFVKKGPKIIKNNWRQRGMMLLPRSMYATNQIEPTPTIWVKI